MPLKMNSNHLSVCSHLFVVTFSIVLIMLFSPWHIIFISPFKAPFLLDFIVVLFFPVSTHPTPTPHSPAHLSEQLQCLSCIYTSNPSSTDLLRYMHSHHIIQCCFTFTQMVLCCKSHSLFHLFHSTLGFGDLSMWLYVNLAIFFLLFYIFHLMNISVCLSSHTWWSPGLLPILHYLKQCCNKPPQLYFLNDLCKNSLEYIPRSAIAGS